MFARILQAYKTLVGADDSAYPRGQATYNGKPTDYVRLSVYGICSNAPDEAHVLLISSQGMESTKFGIENDFLGRLKNLKKGEAALFNSLTESFVILKENGDMECDIKGSIIANATGNMDVTVNGDITGVAAGKIEMTAPTGKFTGNFEFVGSSLKHNGKEIGENHGHTQADDSNGDSEQPISGVT